MLRLIETTSREPFPSFRLDELLEALRDFPDQDKNGAAARLLAEVEALAEALSEKGIRRVLGTLPSDAASLARLRNDLDSIRCHSIAGAEKFSAQAQSLSETAPAGTPPLPIAVACSGLIVEGLGNHPPIFPTPPAQYAKSTSHAYGRNAELVYFRGNCPDLEEKRRKKAVFESVLLRDFGAYLSIEKDGEGTVGLDYALRIAEARWRGGFMAYGDIKRVQALFRKAGAMDVIGEAFSPEIMIYPDDAPGFLKKHRLAMARFAAPAPGLSAAHYITGNPAPT